MSLLPFIKDRTISAIIWFNTVNYHQAQRFDPASKSFIAPASPINERVYSGVQELAAHLVNDFKNARMAAK